MGTQGGDGLTGSVASALPETAPPVVVALHFGLHNLDVAYGLRSYPQRIISMPSKPHQQRGQQFPLTVDENKVLDQFAAVQEAWGPFIRQGQVVGSQSSSSSGHSTSERPAKGLYGSIKQQLVGFHEGQYPGPAYEDLDMWMADFLRRLGEAILADLRLAFARADKLKQLKNVKNSKALKGLVGTDVELVVTVPVLRNQEEEKNVQQVVHEIASWTGLVGNSSDHQVVIRTEAAAVYCKQQVGLWTPHKGETCLFVDTEGDTELFSVVGVENRTEAKVLRVGYEGLQISHENDIDSSLLRYMEHTIATFKDYASNAAKLKGVQDWWDHNKYEFNGEQTITFVVPEELRVSWNAAEKQKKGQKTRMFGGNLAANHRLELGPDVLRSIYDPFVNEICSVINQQLAQSSDCQTDCRTLLLVGKTARLKYLHRIVLEKVGSRVQDILTPEVPTAAVCKGALMIALAHPTLSSSRRLLWMEDSNSPSISGSSRVSSGYYEPGQLPAELSIPSSPARHELDVSPSPAHAAVHEAVPERIPQTMPAADLHLLSSAELQVITHGFSRKIGEGGSGVVFLGELWGVDVAVKHHNQPRLGRLTITMKAAEGIEREFLEEVNTLSALRHPHIVQVLAWGKREGATAKESPLNKLEQESTVSYICVVTEFMEGGSLQERLFGGAHAPGPGLAYRRPTGPMSIASRFQIASQTAAALLAIHDKGLFHLDLKPGNIFLDQHDHSKIGDFGLAKYSPDLKTLSGLSLRGTPFYMCPHRRRTYDVCREVDIYALGLIWLQLLTRLPIKELHRLLSASEETTSSVQPNGSDNLRQAIQSIEDDDVLSFHADDSESQGPDGPHDGPSRWPKGVERTVELFLKYLDKEAGPWNLVLKQARAMLALSLLCVERNRRRRPLLTEMVAQLRIQEHEVGQALAGRSFDTSTLAPTSSSSGLPQESQLKETMTIAASTSDHVILDANEQSKPLVQAEGTAPVAVASTVPKFSVEFPDTDRVDPDPDRAALLIPGLGHSLEQLQRAVLAHAEEVNREANARTQLAADLERLRQTQAAQQVKLALAEQTRDVLESQLAISEQKLATGEGQVGILERSLWHTGGEIQKLQQSIEELQAALDGEREQTSEVSGKLQLTEGQLEKTSTKLHTLELESQGLRQQLQQALYRIAASARLQEELATVQRQLLDHMAVSLPEDFMEVVSCVKELRKAFTYLARGLCHHMDQAGLRQQTMEQVAASGKQLGDPGHMLYYFCSVAASVLFKDFRYQKFDSSLDYYDPHETLSQSIQDFKEMQLVLQSQSPSALQTFHQRQDLQHFYQSRAQALSMHLKLELGWDVPVPSSVLSTLEVPGGSISAFHIAAYHTWALHKRAFSSEPAARLIVIQPLANFNYKHMAMVEAYSELNNPSEDRSIQFMVAPGIKVGQNTVRCQVYPSLQSRTAVASLGQPHGAQHVWQASTQQRSQPASNPLVQLVHSHTTFTSGGSYMGSGVLNHSTSGAQHEQKNKEQQQQQVLDRLLGRPTTDAVAQCSLGEAYETGQGVPVDYGIAVGFYMRASQQGYAHAHYKLALCYQNGWGVRRDDSEARRLLRLAAENGHAEAEANAACG